MKTYTQEEINEIIIKHKKWLNNENEGIRANLSGADLIRANLSDANLIRANLSDADLIRANLSDANLRDADLRGANLSGANLIRANLSDADLSGANLSGADLIRANLSDANLRDADLRGANLSGANLSGANLIRANLIRANLSGAEDYFDASKWFNENFIKTDIGYIVYKAIGNTHYSVSNNWVISENSFISEVANPVVTVECGCGVNFGTEKYVRDNFNDSDIWECILLFEDMPNLVVPLNTDGKCRCNRLKLIKKLTK